MLDNGHVLTDEDVETARLIKMINDRLGKPTDPLTSSIAATPLNRVVSTIDEQAIDEQENDEENMAGDSVATRVVAEAMASDEIVGSYLRLARDSRRTAVLLVALLAVVIFMFGLGVASAVWIAGIKPSVALLIGAAGCATTALLAGFSIRRWVMVNRDIHTLAFFLSSTSRRVEDRSTPS
jgi:hypothetical protein